MTERKLIIFDFDGVIIDSLEHAYGLTRMSWPEITRDEHISLFSGNIFQSISKLPPSAMNEDELKNWMEKEYYPTRLKLSLYKGIDEVLNNLAFKYPLVINTSATGSSTNEYLQSVGLLRCFKKVYGKEISKDKTEKFKMILEEYNLKPEECVLITDTVGDVLEAEHCSIPSVVVTYGYQNRRHFDSIESKVLGFANTPEEIINFIS